jgi:hypothetical protein
MKVVRIEQGRLIAYIEQSDIDTLVKVKDVVPESFFEEEMVVRGYCDENGLYRIENIANVNYIKSAAYIPNRDYMNKLSMQELEKLLKSASYEHKCLVKVLKKLYGRDLLTKEEKNALEESQALKTSLVNEIQETALANNDEPAELRFFVLEECLRAQSAHYTKSISDYVLERKSQIEEEKRNNSKNFSLKRLFGRK